MEAGLTRTRRKKKESNYPIHSFLEKRKGRRTGGAKKHGSKKLMGGKKGK